MNKFNIKKKNRRKQTSSIQPYSVADSNILLYLGSNGNLDIFLPNSVKIGLLKPQIAPNENNSLIANSMESSDGKSIKSNDRTSIPKASNCNTYKSK